MIAPSEFLSLFDAETRSDPPTKAGMHLERAGGIVRTGGPYNLILFSELSEASADAAIADQMAHFRNSPEGLIWKVYGHDHPADLGERLVAAGFKHEDSETLLVLELTGVECDLAELSGVEIKRVSDNAGIDDYVSASDAAFGRNTNCRTDAFGERLGDPTLGIYIAYSGGTPVSVGRVELPAGRSIASLWGGATIPDYRGKGIYTQLVRCRMKEAQRLGFRYITTEARKSSRTILERLGFVPLTSVADFVMKGP